MRIRNGLLHWNNVISLPALRQAVILLMLVLVAAACEDDGPAAPADPCAGSPDARLVGDWLRCDEEWNDLASGMRIGADGSGEVLWTDWTSGRLVVPTESDLAGMQICARGGTLIRRLSSGEADTLSYSLDGDRLEIWQDIPAFPERYRKIEADSTVAEEQWFVFNAIVNGEFYSVGLIAPLMPVSARKGSCGNVTDLHVTCIFPSMFDIVVHDFRGAGRYPLGKAPDTSFVNLVYDDGTASHRSSTDASHTGEIRIISFNETTGRCKGSFFFDAAGVAEDAGITHIVRNGHFDVPIRE